MANSEYSVKIRTEHFSAPAKVVSGIAPGATKAEIIKVFKELGSEFKPLRDDLSKLVTALRKALPKEQRPTTAKPTKFEPLIREFSRLVSQLEKSGRGKETIKIDVKTDTARKSITALERAAMRLSSVIDLTSKSIEGLDKKAKSAVRSIEKVAKSTSDLGKKSSEAVSNIDKIVKAVPEMSDKMKKAANTAVELGAGIDSIIKAAKAKDYVKLAQLTKEAANKTGELIQSTRDLGKGAKAVKKDIDDTIKSFDEAGKQFKKVTKDVTAAASEAKKIGEGSRKSTVSTEKASKKIEDAAAKLDTAAKRFTNVSDTPKTTYPSGGASKKNADTFVKQLLEEQSKSTAAIEKQTRVIEEGAKKKTTQTSIIQETPPTEQRNAVATAQRALGKPPEIVRPPTPVTYNRQKIAEQVHTRVPTSTGLDLVAANAATAKYRREIEKLKDLYPEREGGRPAIYKTLSRGYERGSERSVQTIRERGKIEPKERAAALGNDFIEVIRTLDNTFKNLEAGKHVERIGRAFNENAKLFKYTVSNLHDLERILKKLGKETGRGFDLGTARREYGSDLEKGHTTAKSLTSYLEQTWVPSALEAKARKGFEAKGVDASVAKLEKEVAKMSKDLEAQYKYGLSIPVLQQRGASQIFETSTGVERKATPKYEIQYKTEKGITKVDKAVETSFYRELNEIIKSHSGNVAGRMSDRGGYNLGTSISQIKRDLNAVYTQMPVIRKFGDASGPQAGRSMSTQQARIFFDPPSQLRTKEAGYDKDFIQPKFKVKRLAEIQSAGYGGIPVYKRLGEGRIAKTGKTIAPSLKGVSEGLAASVDVMDTEVDDAVKTLRAFNVEGKKVEQFFATMGLVNPEEWLISKAQIGRPMAFAASEGIGLGKGAAFPHVRSKQLQSDIEAKRVNKFGMNLITELRSTVDNFEDVIEVSKDSSVAKEVVSVFRKIRVAIDKGGVEGSSTFATDDKIKELTMNELNKLSNKLVKSLFGEVGEGTSAGVKMYTRSDSAAIDEIILAAKTIGDIDVDVNEIQILEKFFGSFGRKMTSQAGQKGTIKIRTQEEMGYAEMPKTMGELASQLAINKEDSKIISENFKTFGNTLLMKSDELKSLDIPTDYISKMVEARATIESILGTTDDPMLGAGVKSVEKLKSFAKASGIALTSKTPIDVRTDPRSMAKRGLASDILEGPMNLLLGKGNVPIGSVSNFKELAQQYSGPLGFQQEEGMGLRSRVTTSEGKYSSVVGPMNWQVIPSKEASAYATKKELMSGAHEGKGGFRMKPAYMESFISAFGSDAKILKEFMQIGAKDTDRAKQLVEAMVLLDPAMAGVASSLEGFAISIDHFKDLDVLTKNVGVTLDQFKDTLLDFDKLKTPKQSYLLNLPGVGERGADVNIPVPGEAVRESFQHEGTPYFGPTGLTRHFSNVLENYQRVGEAGKVRGGGLEYMSPESLPEGVLSGVLKKQLSDVIGAASDIGKTGVAGEDQMREVLTNLFSSVTSSFGETYGKAVEHAFMASLSEVKGGFGASWAGDVKSTIGAVQSTKKGSQTHLGPVQTYRRLTHNLLDADSLITGAQGEDLLPSSGREDAARKVLASGAVDEAKRALGMAVSDVSAEKAVMAAVEEQYTARLDSLRESIKYYKIQLAIEAEAEMKKSAGEIMLPGIRMVVGSKPKAAKGQLGVNLSEQLGAGEIQIHKDRLREIQEAMASRMITQDPNAYSGMSAGEAQTAAVQNLEEKGGVSLKAARSGNLYGLPVRDPVLSSIGVKPARVRVYGEEEEKGKEFLLTVSTLEKGLTNVSDVFHEKARGLDFDGDTMALVFGQTADSMKELEHSFKVLSGEVEAASPVEAMRKALIGYIGYEDKKDVAVRSKDTSLEEIFKEYGEKTLERGDTFKDMKGKDSYVSLLPTQDRKTVLIERLMSTESLGKKQGGGGRTAEEAAKEARDIIANTDVTKAISGKLGQGIITEQVWRMLSLLKSGDPQIQQGIGGALSGESFGGKEITTVKEAVAVFNLMIDELGRVAAQSVISGKHGEAAIDPYQLIQLLTKKGGSEVLFGEKGFGKDYAGKGDYSEEFLTIMKKVMDEIPYVLERQISIAPGLGSKQRSNLLSSLTIKDTEREADEYRGPAFAKLTKALNIHREMFRRAGLGGISATDTPEGKATALVSALKKSQMGEGYRGEPAANYLYKGILKDNAFLQDLVQTGSTGDDTFVQQVVASRTEQAEIRSLIESGVTEPSADVEEVKKFKAASESAVKATQELLGGSTPGGLPYGKMEGAGFEDCCDKLAQLLTLIRESIERQTSLIGDSFRKYLELTEHDVDDGGLPYSSSKRVPGGFKVGTAGVLYEKDDVYKYGTDEDKLNKAAAGNKLTDAWMKEIGSRQVNYDDIVDFMSEAYQKQALHTSGSLVDPSLGPARFEEGLKQQFSGYKMAGIQEQFKLMSSGEVTPGQAGKGLQQAIEEMKQSGDVPFTQIKKIWKQYFYLRANLIAEEIGAMDSVIKALEARKVAGEDTPELKMQAEKAEVIYESLINKFRKEVFSSYSKPTGPFRDPIKGGPLQSAAKLGLAAPGAPYSASIPSLPGKEFKDAMSIVNSEAAMSPLEKYRKVWDALKKSPEEMAKNVALLNAHLEGSLRAAKSMGGHTEDQISNVEETVKLFRSLENSIKRFGPSELVGGFVPTKGMSTSERERMGKARSSITAPTLQLNKSMAMLLTPKQQLEVHEQNLKVLKEYIRKYTSEYKLAAAEAREHGKTLFLPKPKGEIKYDFKIYDDYGNVLRNLRKELTLTGKAGNEFKESKMIDVDAQQKGQRGFKGAFKRVALWGAAATVTYGGISALKNSIDMVADFETGIVNLRKVMNPATTDFAKMGAEAVGMAQNYGQALDTVLETMRVFAQQGKIQAEVLDLTNTAVLAANVTTMNSVRATEALTSAYIQFGSEVSSSMGFLDAWNEVENNFAVTADVLADALLRTGAAAKVAGVDFDQFNGLVTGIAEATRQTGKVVGTSMRYILRSLFADKAKDELKTIGIGAFTGAGEKRKAFDVLSDLATRWDTLTESQKLSVAQAIGMRRHYNSLIIMMNRWPRVLKAIKTSEASHGSALRENAIVMETYNKQVDVLKATLTKLGVTFGKIYLGPMTTMMKGMSGLVDLFTELDPWVYKLATGVAAGAAAWSKWGNVVGKAIEAYQGLLSLLSGAPESGLEGFKDLITSSASSTNIDQATTGLGKFIYMMAESGRTANEFGASLTNALGNLSFWGAGLVQLGVKLPSILGPMAGFSTTGLAALGVGLKLVTKLLTDASLAASGDVGFGGAMRTLAMNMAPLVAAGGVLYLLRDVLSGVSESFREASMSPEQFADHSRQYLAELEDNISRIEKLAGERDVLLVGRQQIRGVFDAEVNAALVGPGQTPDQVTEQQRLSRGGLWRSKQIVSGTYESPVLKNRELLNNVQAYTDLAAQEFPHIVDSYDQQGHAIARMGVSMQDLMNTTIDARKELLVLAQMDIASKFIESLTKIDLGEYVKHMIKSMVTSLPVVGEMLAEQINVSTGMSLEMAVADLNKYMKASTPGSNMFADEIKERQEKVSTLAKQRNKELRDLSERMGIIVEGTVNEYSLLERFKDSKVSGAYGQLRYQQVGRGLPRGPHGNIEASGPMFSANELMSEQLLGKAGAFVIGPDDIATMEKFAKLGKLSVQEMVELQKVTGHFGDTLDSFTTVSAGSVGLFGTLGGPQDKGLLSAMGKDSGFSLLGNQAVIKTETDKETGDLLYYWQATVEDIKSKQIEIARTGGMSAQDVFDMAELFLPAELALQLEERRRDLLDRIYAGAGAGTVVPGGLDFKEINLGTDFRHQLSSQVRIAQSSPGRTDFGYPVGSRTQPSLTGEDLIRHAVDLQERYALAIEKSKEAVEEATDGVYSFTEEFEGLQTGLFDATYAIKFKTALQDLQKGLEEAAHSAIKSATALQVERQYGSPLTGPLAGIPGVPDYGTTQTVDQLSAGQRLAAQSSDYRKMAMAIQDAEAQLDVFKEGIKKADDTLQQLALFNSMYQGAKGGFQSTAEAKRAAGLVREVGAVETALVTSNEKQVDIQSKILEIVAKAAGISNSSILESLPSKSAARSDVLSETILASIQDSAQFTQTIKNLTNQLTAANTPLSKSDAVQLKVLMIASDALTAAGEDLQKGPEGLKGAFTNALSWAWENRAPIAGTLALQDKDTTSGHQILAKIFGETLTTIATKTGKYAAGPIYASGYREKMELYKAGTGNDPRLEMQNTLSGYFGDTGGKLATDAFSAVSGDSWWAQIIQSLGGAKISEALTPDKNLHELINDLRNASLDVAGMTPLVRATQETAINTAELVRQGGGASESARKALDEIGKASSAWTASTPEGQKNIKTRYSPAEMTAIATQRTKRNPLATLGNIAKLAFSTGGVLGAGLLAKSTPSPDAAKQVAGQAIGGINKKIVDFFVDRGYGDVLKSVLKQNDGDFDKVLEILKDQGPAALLESIKGAAGLKDAYGAQHGKLSEVAKVQKSMAERTNTLKEFFDKAKDEIRSTLERVSFSRLTDQLMAPLVGAMRGVASKGDVALGSYEWQLSGQQVTQRAMPGLYGSISEGSEIRGALNSQLEQANAQKNLAQRTGQTELYNAAAERVRQLTSAIEKYNDVLGEQMEIFRDQVAINETIKALTDLKESIRKFQDLQYDTTSIDLAMGRHPLATAAPQILGGQGGYQLGAKGLTKYEQEMERIKAERGYLPEPEKQRIGIQQKLDVLAYGQSQENQKLAGQVSYAESAMSTLYDAGRKGVDVEDIISKLKYQLERAGELSGGEYRGIPMLDEIENVLGGVKAEEQQRDLSEYYKYLVDPQIRSMDASLAEQMSISTNTGMTVKLLQDLVSLYADQNARVVVEGTSAIGFASGGHVSGGTPGRDSVPAMLSPGEFVVNARSTSKHKDWLEMLNAGAIPGFAGGGRVTREIYDTHGNPVGYKDASGNMQIWSKKRIEQQASLATMSFAQQRARTSPSETTTGIGVAMANSQFAAAQEKEVSNAAKVKRSASFLQSLKGLGGVVSGLFIGRAATPDKDLHKNERVFKSINDFNAFMDLQGGHRFGSISEMEEMADIDPHTMVSILTSSKDNKIPPKVQALRQWLAVEEGAYKGKDYLNKLVVLTDLIELREKYSDNKSFTSLAGLSIRKTALRSESLENSRRAKTGALSLSNELDVDLKGKGMLGRLVAKTNYYSKDAALKFRRGVDFVGIGTSEDKLRRDEYLTRYELGEEGYTFSGADREKLRYNLAGIGATGISGLLSLGEGVVRAPAGAIEVAQALPGMYKTLSDISMGDIASGAIGAAKSVGRLPYTTSIDYTQVQRKYVNPLGRFAGDMIGFGLMTAGVGTGIRGVGKGLMTVGKTVKAEKYLSKVITAGKVPGRGAEELLKYNAAMATQFKHPILSRAVKTGMRGTEVASVVGKGLKYGIAAKLPYIGGPAFAGGLLVRNLLKGIATGTLKNMPFAEELLGVLRALPGGKLLEGSAVSGRLGGASKSYMALEGAIAEKFGVKAAKTAAKKIIGSSWAGVKSVGIKGVPKKAFDVGIKGAYKHPLMGLLGGLGISATLGPAFSIPTLLASLAGAGVSLGKGLAKPGSIGKVLKGVGAAGAGGVGAASFAGYGAYKGTKMLFKGLLGAGKGAYKGAYKGAEWVSRPANERILKKLKEGLKGEGGYLGKKLTYQELLNKYPGGIPKRVLKAHHQPLVTEAQKELAAFQSKKSVMSNLTDMKIEQLKMSEGLARANPTAQKISDIVVPGWGEGRQIIPKSVPISSTSPATLSAASSGKVVDLLDEVINPSWVKSKVIPDILDTFGEESFSKGDLVFRRISMDKLKAMKKSGFLNKPGDAAQLYAGKGRSFLVDDLTENLSQYPGELLAVIDWKKLKQDVLLKKTKELGSAFQADKWMKANFFEQTSASGAAEVGNILNEGVSYEYLKGYYTPGKKGLQKYNLGGLVQGFANGGFAGTDTVPAMLTPGEFVVNASAASRYGDLLESINKNGGVERLQDGGFVGRRNSVGIDPGAVVSVDASAAQGQLAEAFSTLPDQLVTAITKAFEGVSVTAELSADSQRAIAGGGGSVGADLASAVDGLAIKVGQFGGDFERFKGDSAASTVQVMNKIHETSVAANSEIGKIKGDIINANTKVREVEGKTNIALRNILN